jgi:hypothetical protein
MTTALVMWIFGFICGALAYWVRGLRAQQRHDRAVAELDAFVKPAVESIFDPKYKIRPDSQVFGRR